MSRRYLIVANSSSGLYGFRKELIAELQKAGTVYVSVPVGENAENLEEMGCIIIDTPMERRGINPVKDIGLLLRYLRVVSQINPDIVITYTIKPNIYAGAICRFQKIPYAVNITGLGSVFQNGGLLKKIVTCMYKVAIKKAKVVFFENAENRQILLDECIVRKEQCCLLSGAGVNLKQYSYVDYPTDQDVTRFLFIGRIMKEKGVEELFTAVRRLWEEGYHCCLDVLGRYEEDYAQCIAMYEQEGWLNYHGYQMDVRPYIKNAHCFVLPSWHEGMANTNLECAAMGRPLITSNIHGCKEAVIENVSGYLCEKQDAESLYQVMKKFMKLSCAEREQMGRRGREHMSSLFDKRKVVEKTVNMLNI